MPSAKIDRISIQGFRSFGRTAQTLDISAPIVAVHASNSQGKTSLAEAFEFLLTGEIVRRSLTASSQDEFADALRNVHLQPGEEVYVEAQFIGPDAQPHTLRRTLVSDYGRGSNQGCSSTLRLDCGFRRKSPAIPG